MPRDNIISRMTLEQQLRVYLDLLPLAVEFTGYYQVGNIEGDEGQSLKIYKSSAKWWEFNGAHGGDCVTFVMLHFGFETYKEAVNYLEENKYLEPIPSLTSPTPTPPQTSADPIPEGYDPDVINQKYFNKSPPRPPSPFDPIEEPYYCVVCYRVATMLHPENQRWYCEGHQHFGKTQR